MKQLTVLALATFLSVGQALACSCMDSYPTAAEVLKDSQAVFLGIPSAKSKVSGQAEAGPQMTTKFLVVKNFKGAKSKSISLQSLENDGGNCGVSFEKNEGLILVQAYKEDGKLWISECSVNFFDPEDQELLKLISDLTKKAE